MGSRFGLVGSVDPDAADESVGYHAGVLGASLEDDIGVRGVSYAGFGTIGWNGGVAGDQTPAAGTMKPAGVYGVTSNMENVGVFGRNAATTNRGYLGGKSAGASGTSTTGTGVVGTSSSGVGVRAVGGKLSGGGTALLVEGIATFSRSGIAAVKAGQRTTRILGIDLISASGVLATIQERRDGIHVESAIPDPGTASLRTGSTRPSRTRPR